MLCEGPGGAGLSRRRTAANTGEAGAIHCVACFAGEPAPTGLVNPPLCRSLSSCLAAGWR
ncbi:hypothetical protein EI693_23735 [Pseudomonas oryziphila]|uniref:Diguanylate cyclase n=1 Tax=Pseudomonas oryziphila TaxID=2894079 RepID=A0ABM7CYE5_9PSED|nr:hypothetical protein EI693_23735 [Pseudomonas oryziphila]